jgi:hypothetical protein
MSSFEWMELQSLTSDIELARSRLTEARGRGDRGRVRALEEEITRAEKTRLQLLTHISTNIASAPEAAAASKAKEAVAAGEDPSAVVAEALQEVAAGDQPPAEPVDAAEPAPRRGSAAARRASARAAEAAQDEAEEEQALDEPAEAPESVPVAEAADDAKPGATSAPAAEALPDEAGGKQPLSESIDPIAASSPASPASAPKADRKGDPIVWDQLTPADLERAKNELGTRRAEVLARHAEEIKGLDAEQTQLETLEQAIDAFLQKMKALSGGSTVVELRQQGNG